MGVYLQSRRIENLTGVVLPLSWDDDENITRVSILAFHDREYIVEKNEFSELVAKLAGKIVEFDGWVTEYTFGTPTVELDYFALYEPTVGTPNPIPNLEGLTIRDTH